MADSTDTDSQAPTEFPLSSSEDDLLEKTSVASHKCPVCRSAKKYYFCADCIKNGDFFYSQSTPHRNGVRFIEKKLLLLKVQGEMKEALVTSRAYMDRRQRIDILYREVKERQEKIRLLQKWKLDVERTLNNNLPVLNELKISNQEAVILVEKLKKEAMESKKSLLQNSEKTKVIGKQLEEVTNLLKQVIRENVKQLVQYIFPICCEGQISSEEDSESLATVKDALADASQQTYVRGQWIYADAGHGNCQYIISGATLPGTGDITAYQLCVKQLNEDKDSESLRHFKVALSHAAQLSQVLAFYFGIRLPKKVAYRDFACNDLDTKRFASRISRLHANILFLCSSQGVSPAHLRHINPLARLLTLLDPNVCDLGRFGPFEFHPELWSFEDAGDDENTTMSDSSDEEDSDPLNADWESVVNLPSVEQLVSNKTSQTSSGSSIDSRTSPAIQTSVMGGVVSGVASLWNKWPWSK